MKSDATNLKGHRELSHAHSTRPDQLMVGTDQLCARVVNSNAQTRVDERIHLPSWPLGVGLPQGHSQVVGVRLQDGGAKEREFAESDEDAGSNGTQRLAHADKNPFNCSPVVSHTVQHDLSTASGTSSTRLAQSAASQKRLLSSKVRAASKRLDKTQRKTKVVAHSAMKKMAEKKPSESKKPASTNRLSAPTKKPAARAKSTVSKKLSAVLDAVTAVHEHSRISYWLQHKDPRDIIALLHERLQSQKGLQLLSTLFPKELMPDVNSPKEALRKRKLVRAATA